jgi:ABC-type glycerol-3-phosphate transport system substrate-binding protein
MSRGFGSVEEKAVTDGKSGVSRDSEPGVTGRLLASRPSRRKVLQAGAIAGLSAVTGSILAACGIGASSSAPSSSAPSAAASASAGAGASPSTASGPSLDPTKTVRIWIQNYGDPQQQATALATIAAAFKEATGVTVKFEGQDWATAEQKWDLAMSRGDLPDIGDMFYLPSRIVQGQGKWGPVDLTSRVDAGAFGNWDRIVKASRDESTIDSKVYGIPWRIDIRAWTGRSDIFPSVPKTVAELESMGLEALKKPGVQTATTHFAQPVDALHQGGLAYGTTFLSPDYKTSNLMDPKWVEVGKWMRDLTTKKIFSAQSELDGKFNQNGSMYSGATGAVYGGGTILTEAQGVAPQVVSKLVSGLMPAGPVGTSRSHGSCAQWSIFQNSPAIDEAAAFLAWLSTDAHMSSALNQATSTISADADVQKLDTNPYYGAFYEQAKDIEPTDMPIVAWNEMRVFPDGPLNVMANRVWGTTDDVATIFADGHKAITDILAKYA